MTLSAEINSGVAILFTVLFIVIAPVVIYLLYRGVKKDRQRFREGALAKSELTKEGFDEIARRRFQNATGRTQFSVFRIVINDAKSVQKTFGDLQYKNAVRVLISRLEKIFPETVKMCHYDYDELWVLIEEQLGAKELGEYANFIIIECSKTIALAANLQVELDVNIGIASFNEFNRTYDMFRQNLELAVVVSKRNGVNRFVLHTPELNNKESAEYKYYQEIKDAIDKNEFTLYFQPFVDVNTLEFVGFETLLRWNHRELGLLSPAKFLNILEQTGDINWVGLWAYEEMLVRQLVWRQRSPSKKFILSMNLSPKQLVNENLVDDMRRILRKYRIEPSSICMEIIEFAYFEKMPIVKENIEKLIQCGFMIAIDNYGPEMNTLALLDQVKIDIIKLDRDFVKKAQTDFLSNGLLKTLIEYSKKNETKILAEGIEDQDVLEYIKEVGINYAQGYLFGKPQSPEQWEHERSI